MIIRNGVSSTLRARGRTVLFTLLILVLTLTLTLGMGMWAYCARMLAAMDESYTSIALVEYMGADYPDANAADEFARSAAEGLDGGAISGLDGVELWEETDRTLALLEGYRRPDRQAPYKDSGVIVVSGLAPSYRMARGEADEEELYAYTALLSQAIYTLEGKDNVFVIVELGDHEFTAEPGQRYLLHGTFVEGGTGNRIFALTDFYEGCETEPWLAVDGRDDPALTDSIFAQYADYYRAANNYVTLEASSGVAALEVFQQGTLYLEEGRFPEAGETGVCVISRDIASQLELTVGDALSLTVMTSEVEDRFGLTVTDDSRFLTVVGITNPVDDYAGSVWASGDMGGFDSPLFGYQLGRAVLDNGKARQAADAIQAMAPDGVRVTLLDQGYSAAAQPLETMRTTAMAVTIAAACGALAVLFLFACLFVGRQRETVLVLVSLGTPAGKIRLWLLSGVTLIAGAAALAGAAAGAAVLGRIIELALYAARELYTADQRYSEAAVGAVREAVAAESVPLWPAAAAGVAVFALALLLCLFFLGRTRKEAAPKRGKVSVRAPKSGTSVSGGGAVRFALLSAKRGGWRSAVVPAAALVLSLFLGILASGAQGWSGQIDALYQNTRLTGQVTSANGRQLTGLTVSADSARELWKSGLLKDIAVSKSWNYWFYDEMPAFGTGSFAEENRRAWIARQPKVVALNSLSAAPEFTYGKTPEVNWLEGWDESFLADDAYPSFVGGLRFFRGRVLGYDQGQQSYPCLVSESFLARRGLELGGEFNLSISYKHSNYDYDLYMSLKVVGTFEQTGKDANIYVPLSFWCDPAWITGETDVMEPGERANQSFTTDEERNKFFYFTTKFETCRFTLASPCGLEDFRSYLAQRQFSQAGQMNKNRTTVLLRDQTFTETVGGLGRYITFSRILFPVLFLAVGLLGFVISWLMVNGRRMEFAIMRGLGASRGRVFLSFFLEQGILCLAGCLLGCLALLLIPGGGWAQWLAALGFLLCYLAGCGLSVLAVGRTHLISLLSERE